MLQEISRCQLCAAHLPHGVRPVVQASSHSRILIVGQAPGRKVHETGIPWNDPSGDQLRLWLGVDSATFYDPDRFALMPMGFCFPGSGKQGDLPPRQECAPKWHPQLLPLMPDIQLTLLVGLYAQTHYLSDGFRTLTERVKHWADCEAGHWPLPHPSPRNRMWQRNNPWFQTEVVPLLQQRVKGILLN
nr:uracil-DNA glycosylase family protein [Marinicella sp. NBU2979]